MAPPAASPSRRAPPPPDVVLVVPCHDEAARLRPDAFSAFLSELLHLARTRLPRLDGLPRKAARCEGPHCADESDRMKQRSLRNNAVLKS